MKNGGLKGASGKARQNHDLPDEGVTPFVGRDSGRAVLHEIKKGRDEGREKEKQA